MQPPEESRDDDSPYDFHSKKQRLKAEQTERLIRETRSFLRLTSQVQKGIAEKLMQQPEIAAEIEAFKRQSDNRCMEKIDRALDAFIQAVPFATAMEINLFLSALARHSSVTGNPLIQQIVMMINEETTEENLRDG